MTSTTVLVFDKKKLVIPTAEIQVQIIQWYHHYLQHTGKNWLEETIFAVIYWTEMSYQIRKNVKTCERCQLDKRHKRKYGHLPPKTATIVPWNQNFVDLVGPYTIKAKDGTIMDFMCLTMIDPATSWLEIVEFPTRDITYVRKNGE